MKVLTVLGTRPEIIKLSPLLPLLDEHFEHRLVHTGQHYSYEMDRIFFDELRIRDPDHHLDVGSGSHAAQTAAILAKLDPILERERPGLVIVQGDTNSTLAGALCAAKRQIPVAHVEAGCRSFNRAMPEELNRILTDHLSSFLFAIDEGDVKNLLTEGIPKEKIHLTGRTSSVACRRNLQLAQASPILGKHHLKPREFIVATVHRAENTDDQAQLREIMESLEEIASEMTVIVPLHPRTRKLLQEFKISLRNITVIEPLGYLDFLKLASEAYLLLSDSGGIQEEAVELNVPCLILRNETEHRAFVAAGKNLLVGTRKAGIVKKAQELIRNEEDVRRMRDLPFATEHDAPAKIIRILKAHALISL